MKQDTFDMILGLGVMALGIGLLLFTFASALALVANPGAFIADQVPAGPAQVQAPIASFTWSSNGFNLSVQDTSIPASGSSLSSWQWNFGDGSPDVSGQHPGTHVYPTAGSYYVTLTVTDSNGPANTAFAPVLLVPSGTRSGQNIVNPGSQLSLGNLNFADLLLPVAVGTLTVGLYLAMAVVGGMILKAGWNLVRPRPETVRIRLKPKHLQQMVEEDSALPAAPPPPPPQA